MIIRAMLVFILTASLILLGGTTGAGGIHAYETTIIVRNTIVAFNTGAAGVTWADADHCILFGNEGTDTFSPTA